MGLSIRARRWLKQQQAEKRERRAAEEADREAAARRFHAEFLDRERTAARLGISVHTLKRWGTAGTGPTPIKMGGTKQARTFWPLEEIEKFLANPAAYEAAKLGPAE